jgi:hypothetical protein
MTYMPIVVTAQARKLANITAANPLANIGILLTYPNNPGPPTASWSK